MKNTFFAEIIWTALLVKLLNLFSHESLVHTILQAKPEKITKNYSPEYLFYLSDRLSKLTLWFPFSFACYEKAITARYFLNKAGIENTLFIGKEKTKSAFHAWLVVDDFCVTGQEVLLENYIVLHQYL